MKPRLPQFVALITALCLLVQSVGAAAGGFLCVGCPNTLVGVSIASAPCNEIDACCSDQPLQTLETCPDSCPDHSEHSKSQDCGCIDISISISASAMSVPQGKLVLSFASFADPIPALVGCDDLVDRSLRISWTVRGGPPIVRTLAPSSRRTVLLI